MRKSKNVKILKYADMISVISRYVFKIPGEIRALWQVGMSVCMMFIEYESDILGGMARTTC